MFGTKRINRRLSFLEERASQARIDLALLRNKYRRLENEVFEMQRIEQQEGWGDIINEEDDDDTTAYDGSYDSYVLTFDQYGERRIYNKKGDNPEVSRR